jgi:hypothetical protein
MGYPLVSGKEQQGQTMMIGAMVMPERGLHKFWRRGEVFSAILGAFKHSLTSETQISDTMCFLRVYK